MEEINLKEIFDYFKSNLIRIIIAVFVVVIIGNYYSIIIRKPLYRSNTTIILVGGNNSGNYSSTDAQLNKNLVSTYSEIIKSRKVLTTVINNLGLDMSAESLSGQISVSSVTNTEIIKINVSNPNGQVAAKIANEIAKAFSDEVKTIYNLENVSIVDEAIANDVPYNVNFMKDNVIYLLIGLILSFGTVFVMYYFDTTIKSDDVIEQKLGLTVLGIVPKEV